MAVLFFSVAFREFSAVCDGRSIDLSANSPRIRWPSMVLVGRSMVLMAVDRFRLPFDVLVSANSPWFMAFREFSAVLIAVDGFRWPFDGFLMAVRLASFREFFAVLWLSVNSPRFLWPSMDLLGRSMVFRWLSCPVPSRPVPSCPVASRPVPSRPVPSRPVPSRPVPSRPVPSRPVPSRPVPSRPVPSRCSKSLPRFRRPFTGLDGHSTGNRQPFACHFRDRARPNATCATAQFRRRTSASEHERALPNKNARFRI